ncbi:MAG: hypothetical protein NTW78_10605 [Campylobacterales bacterium]|nr:hypothetical protein [Campylobacterales bacterium]
MVRKTFSTSLHRLTCKILSVMVDVKREESNATLKMQKGQTQSQNQSQMQIQTQW